MKPIFGRGPSLQLRLFLAILLSASLMLADSRLGAFTSVRYLLNSFVAPLQFAANMPRDVLDNTFVQLTSRERLISENDALKNEVLHLKSDLLLKDQYEQENQRLRQLLGSPFVRDERKMIAEVMAVDSSPYQRQIMIDKGRTNGVYEGQPVINEKGIVGQVAYVGAHNSRVVLLTDPNHAIPVQVMRNDIRVIASGTGEVDTLRLDNIPSSTDIDVGDKLVSSGLGGVFPEGYPVGTITSFAYDNQRPFADVIAKPAVSFDRLRYVLLVWPTGVERNGVSVPEDAKPAVTPNDVDSKVNAKPQPEVTKPEAGNGD